MSKLRTPTVKIVAAGDDWATSDYINGILGEGKWNANSLTFAFPALQSDFTNLRGVYGDITQEVWAKIREVVGNFDHQMIGDTLELSTVTVFNTAQQAIANQAMGQISSFTNLDFRASTSGSGNIRFANVSQANPGNTAMGISPEVDMPRILNEKLNDPLWTIPLSLEPNGQVILTTLLLLRDTGFLRPAWGDSFFTAGRYDAPVTGNHQGHSIYHELGHALGLSHGHERDVFQENQGILPRRYDSQEYSIMTYRSFVGGSTRGGYTVAPDNHAQTFMMSDIAALQYLYGANFRVNGGSTTYSFNPNTGEVTGREGARNFSFGIPAANKIFMTIWDGNGTDTYNFGRYDNDLNIDLRPGEFSTTSTEQLSVLGQRSGADVLARGNVANALLYQGDLRSLIENAIGGSGDDRISGNQAQNRLEGGNGDDTLLGVDGDDNLFGNAGNDRLNGGLGNDRQRGGEGEDTLVGGEGSDQLYGDAGDDRINGTNGDDSIFGGLGDDTLRGGDGRDTIRGDAGEDVLTGDGGNDRLFGGNGNDELDGGGSGEFQSENDELFGGDGSDTLRGNTGRDNVNGGAGDDILIVLEGDVEANEILDGGDGEDVLELVGEIDLSNVTIRSIESIGYDEGSPPTLPLTVSLDASQFSPSGLSLGLNIQGFSAAVESVTIRLDGESSFDASGFSFTDWKSEDFLQIVGNDAAGTDVIRGSSDNDIIIGNAGDDALRGNQGADQLFGGAGNDEFGFESNHAAFGEVIDGGDGIADVIRGSNNADLSGATIRSIEVLAIDGSIPSPGNRNTMTFDSSQFGVGAISETAAVWGWNPTDNDTLIIELTGEKPFSVAGLSFSFWNTGGGEGVGDEVRIIGVDSDAFGQGGHDSITGSQTDDVIQGRGGNDSISSGNGADILTGDSGNDTLNGGAESDVLNGGLGNDRLVGGTGLIDLLTGGVGTDTFVLNRDTIGSADAIQDFVGGIDKIELTRDAFKELALGNVTGKEFENSIAASSSSIRLFFDKGTGNLFYDEDGNGAIAAVLIATLGGTVTVQATDFIVV